MKKIFITLLLICLYIYTYSFNVKASQNLKPLVIAINTEVDLNISGFTLIDTNLNLKKTGTYYANYQSGEKHFTREIIVVSSFNENDEVLLCKNVSNITFNGKLTGINNVDNWLLSITKEDHITSFNLIKEQEMITKEVFFDEDTTLKLITSDDDFIYVVGERYYQTRGTDIILVKFDYDLEQILYRTFGGEKNETVQSITCDNDYLYICGETLSKDFILPHEQRMIDTYILKVDKSNFFNYIGIIDNTNDNNWICKIDLDDQYLYALSRNIGDNFIETKIIKYDLNLNQKAVRLIPSFEHEQYVDFKQIGNTSYYFATPINQDILNLYEVNKEIKITSFNNTKKGSFTNYQDVYLIYQTDEVFLHHHNNVSRLTSNIGITYAFNNLMFCTKDLIDHQYHIFQYDVLKYNYDDYTLNTLAMRLQPLPTSHNCFKKDTFGIYKVNARFINNYFEFSHSYDEKVPLISSVKSHTSYMIPYQLTFNGVAYLNDQMIYNGYIINEEGNYTLKVKGQNSFESITFTTKDYKTIKNIHIDHLLDGEGIIQDDLHTPNLLLSINKDQTTKEEPFNYIYFMLIPIACLCITIIVSIKIWRKDK